jgi:hypothetical protein
MIGLVMAVYMIVLGFRAQAIEGGKRILRNKVLQTSWGKAVTVLGVLAGLIAVYLLSLVAFDRFGMGKLVVWVSLLVIVAFV